jgi:hypothetical protein
MLVTQPQTTEKSRTSFGPMLSQYWCKTVKPAQQNMTPVQRPVRKLRIWTFVAVDFIMLELELTLAAFASELVFVEEEEDCVVMAS